MVYLQTKNTNYGKFWSVFQCKMLVNFIAIWSTYVTAISYILWPCGMFYGQVVHKYMFWSFWYILHGLVCCAKKNLATLSLDHTWKASLAVAEIGPVL
jgi:hypothetical protein